jgi:PHD/YefM family antitoxin component YafN of YafNO toxin-antitoxin module
MKGIQFVIDEQGRKKAVLIDLEEWGQTWEDIYDVLVARSRQDEPTVDWEELKAEMAQEEEAQAG